MLTKPYPTIAEWRARYPSDPVVVIDGPGVRFPVIAGAGFGAVDVDLRPGETQRVAVGGKQILVHRRSFN